LVHSGKVLARLVCESKAMHQLRHKQRNRGPFLFEDGSYNEHALMNDGHFQWTSTRATLSRRISQKIKLFKSAR